MLELVNILVYHHLTKNKESSVANHLLFCNHSAFYDNFSILTRENKKYLLELKQSRLIMRDKPSLNRNIGKIVPFRQGLVLGSCSNFILFYLIVATLFLFNGLVLLFGHV